MGELRYDQSANNAVTALLINNGSDIVRIHNVSNAKATIDIADMIRYCEYKT